MQVALIFDPDSADDLRRAKRFFQFPETGEFPEQEIEPKPETQPPPFETESPLSLADLRVKAAAIARDKGTPVLQTILDNVGISCISECPDNKVAKLAAEIALHA